MINAVLSYLFVFVPLTGGGMNLRDLYNELKKVENPKILGVQLGLEYNEVNKIIRQESCDIDNQILAICAKWIENTENPSWQAVSAALEDQYPNIARRIRENHLHVSCKLSC